MAAAQVRYSGNPQVSDGDPRRRDGQPRLIDGQLDDFDAVAAELQSDRQQRAEGVVAAGSRVEGVEEELRLAVESRRDRGMAWRQSIRAWT